MDFRPRNAAACGALAVGLALCAPQGAQAGTAAPDLAIYLIDVEGGGATLIVTPARQSVLIDGGWDTPASRDSQRVLAAAHRAGIDHLDYVVVTHYHSDHLGGIVRLAPQIRITRFLDRGPMKEPIPYVSEQLYSKYLELSEGRRRQLHPAERIELRARRGGPALALLVLAANGVTDRSLTSYSNRACAGAQDGPAGPGENANSIALLLEFGAFRYLAGADLPGHQEFELVCPANQIGAANVYQVDHHSKSTSSIPVLLASMHAQAALINNGPNKGGDASVFNTLRKAFDLRDIYQIHRNVGTSTDENAPMRNLANPDATDGGFGFEVRVSGKGMSYQIVNERTHEVRDYASTR